MGNYTLWPKGDHGVSKKEVMKQLVFFLKTMRHIDLLEFDGWQDFKKDIATRRRWGSLEAGALANAARRHPDRLGLVDDDGELTYAEFLDQVYKLAHALQDLGVKDGGHVAVMAHNGRASIFPLCARQMLGFHIFMINANSSGAQIERVMDFHEIDTLIVDQCFYDRLTPATRERATIILGHLDGEAPEGVPTLQGIIDAKHVGVDRLPEKPTQSQHILMTSGTTGMPKGVVRRQLKSPQGIGPAFASVPIRQNQTVLLSGVLFHFYGWANLLVTMVCNSTIVTERENDPERILADLEKYKINAWVASASRLRGIIAYMDEHNIEPIDQLDYILCSGSPLTPPTRFRR